MTVTHYQNPILRGMYPDPSIVLVENTFYMVNSTFEYYPGISLSRSTDLLNWEKLPGIARTPQQADLRSSKSNEGIFAVCIRYHKGHFYVITTNFAEFKNFIIKGQLSEDKNQIIWEDKRVEVDIFGIDPDLYFEDGHTYVQFTGYVEGGQKAIQQVEINLETGAILRGPEVLTFGTGGRDVEGPHILRQKGTYYLLAAEGGTGQGHMITMFKGDSLWGPFSPAPSNPLFTNRDRAEEPIQNIGHADLFQDPKGNWWLTCLGTRPATIDHIQITNIGRETLLYPVNWSDTWPIIYTGVPSKEVDLADFPTHTETLAPQELPAFVDYFQSDQLHPEWISLRDDLGERLTIGNGRLTLTGSDLTLSDLGTPSFLGVRQTEHEEVLTVTLDKEQANLTEGAAGIATVINNEHYAALLLKPESNHYLVQKQIKVLDLEVLETIGIVRELPDQLILRNTKETKEFSLVSSQETISFTTRAQHFSNEALAALNTGDMQGLYVLGKAQLTVTAVERQAGES